MNENKLAIIKINKIESTNNFDFEEPNHLNNKKRLKIKKERELLKKNILLEKEIQQLKKKITQIKSKKNNSKQKKNLPKDERKSLTGKIDPSLNKNKKIENNKNKQIIYQNRKKKKNIDLNLSKEKKSISIHRKKKIKDFEKKSKPTSNQIRKKTENSSLEKINKGEQYLKIKKLSCQKDSFKNLLENLKKIKKENNQEENIKKTQLLKMKAKITEIYSLINQKLIEFKSKENIKHKERFSDDKNNIDAILKIQKFFRKNFKNHKNANTVKKSDQNENLNFLNEKAIYNLDNKLFKNLLLKNKISKMNNSNQSKAKNTEDLKLNIANEEKIKNNLIINKEKNEIEKCKEKKDIGNSIIGKLEEALKKSDIQINIIIKEKKQKGSLIDNTQKVIINSKEQIINDRHLLKNKLEEESDKYSSEELIINDRHLLKNKLKEESYKYSSKDKNISDNLQYSQLKKKREKHNSKQNLNRQNEEKIGDLQKLNQNKYYKITSLDVPLLNRKRNQKNVKEKAEGLEKLVKKEYENWNNQKKALDEIEMLINNKNDIGTDFKKILNKMKKKTNCNLTNLKKHISNVLEKNTLRESSSKKSFYKKNEMVYWQDLKIPKLDLSESFFFKNENNSQKAFFKTERNFFKKSSSKNLNYFSTKQLEFLKCENPVNNGLHSIQNKSFLKLSNLKIENEVNTNNLLLKVESNKLFNDKKHNEFFKINELDENEKNTLKNNIINDFSSDSKNLFEKSRINEKKSLLALNESKEYLECIEIEIPKQKKYLFPNCEETKEKCVDIIFDLLIEDLLKNSKWGSFIYIMYDNIRKFHDFTEGSENEETVYGIRTNMNAISEYCSYLINYIIENHNNLIKNKLFQISEKFKSEYSSNHIYAINTDNHNLLKKNFPVIKQKNNFNNFYDFSQFISKIDKKSFNNFKFEVWLTKSNPDFIFTEEIYINLEKSILDSYKDMQIMEELFKMQKIFHRSIFDTFNEIFFSLIHLNKIFHFPFEIFTQLRSNNINDKKIEFILNLSKKILLEKSMFCCGLIKDKEDSFFPLSLKDYDMNSIEVIKEERMNKMIYSDFAETKQQTFPFTQLITFVTDIIAKDIENHLLEDMLSDFFL